MDLISLQQSSKTIKNPFRDLIVNWGGKPLMFKKGTQVTLVGRLADHVARHLYMAVYYGYHDERKAEVMEKLGQKAGNKFRVSAEVEDKIWFMITGVHKHKKTTEELQQEVMDITELSRNLEKVEELQSATAEVGSIADFLDKANTSAIKTGNSISGLGVKVEKGFAAREHDILKNSQSNDPIIQSLENKEPVADAPKVSEAVEAPAKVEKAEVQKPNEVPEFETLAQMNG